MIGRVLNGLYRIEELIGTGGMAEVYRAVTLSGGKTVAIKVPKDEFKDDPEFLRRFEREARAVLQLDQENIVRAYGVGVEDGLPYIAMEYVAGRTLKEIIREEGVLLPEEAVDYGCQILKALSAAHEAGIIHRDIKPQNVIVTPEGNAKLTDFGIARETRGSTLTYHGSDVLGSVHYLSPEQAKGIAAGVESDLYSAGIMLYEMLCGSVPFSGDNSVAVALMHINDKAEPLIDRNPDVPPALNSVIMKSIGKDIRSRYHSAEDMFDDLIRALEAPEDILVEEEDTEEIATVVSSGHKKRVFFNWLYLIVTAVLILIGVLIILFIQVRSRYRDTEDGLETVPALTGKDMDEASLRAENFGFLMQVDSFEVSDTVPYGIVMSQSPETGTKALPGSTVSVTVSIGTGSPIMPKLIGLTPDEAKAAIEEAGLVLKETKYMISDVSIGIVCQQMPVYDTEVPTGTEVTLFISSASEETFTMPELTDKSFSSALEILSGYGFRNIRIREVNDESYMDETVLGQSPEAGSFVLEDTPVEITLNSMCIPDNAADVAFNLDVEESGTLITVTIPEAQDGVSFERILYEATLEKGEKIPLSLTARSINTGNLEIRLYINGELVRSSEFAFTERMEG